MSTTTELKVRTIKIKCRIKIFVVVADSSLWPTVLSASQDKSTFVCLDIYSTDCNSMMVAVSCGTLSGIPVRECDAQNTEQV